MTASLAESFVESTRTPFVSPRRALWLAVVSAAARAPGFLIPVVVGAVFGAGSQTDAYFLAYGSVLLIGGTLGQGIEVSVVPYAARALAGATPAISFFDRKALRSGLATAMVYVLVVPIVLLAAARLRGPVAGYAAAFFPLTVGWGAASIYSGALISQGRIASASASLLWRGLGGAVGFMLAPAGGGLWAVALGLGLGEIIRVIWLRRAVLRLGNSAEAASEVTIGSFQRAAIAIIFAGFAGGSAPVIEKLLATSLGSGAVSHLEYAVRLLMIPSVLFDGALGPALLSRLSGDYAVHGIEPTLRRTLGPLLQGMAVAALCGVLLSLFAPTLVRVLLAHGRFHTADVQAVSRVLQWLTIGFVGGMGALLLERAFIAGARTRVMAVLSLPRVALRVLVAVTLLPRMGLLAFPAGYAASEWSYFLVLAFLARERHG